MGAADRAAAEPGVVGLPVEAALSSGAAEAERGDEAPLPPPSLLSRGALLPLPLPPLLLPPEAAALPLLLPSLGVVLLPGCEIPLEMLPAERTRGVEEAEVDEGGIRRDLGALWGSPVALLGEDPGGRPALLVPPPAAGDEASLLLEGLVWLLLLCPAGDPSALLFAFGFKPSWPHRIAPPPAYSLSLTAKHTRGGGGGGYRGSKAQHMGL